MITDACILIIAIKYLLFIDSCKFTYIFVILEAINKRALILTYVTVTSSVHCTPSSKLVSWMSYLRFWREETGGLSLAYAFACVFLFCQH